jgi:hypothetical protein
MVAGHAITAAESLEGANTTDAVWYLLPYQRDKVRMRHIIIIIIIIIIRHTPTSAIR